MSPERRSSSEVTPQTENILRNPPQLILVFDNFRGPTRKTLEILTMSTRAAIAALIYHSNLYQNESLRPTIGCFAGKHTPDGIPGSDIVASQLQRYAVPPEKIYTKQNTITTVYDLLQLHTTIQARNIQSVLIVTTNDHLKRTVIEVRNHFLRRGKNIKMPQIEVIGSSSEILQKIPIPAHLDERTKRQMFSAIERGKTSLLDSKFQEVTATLIASIPNRMLRRIIQSFAEAKTHRHTPPDLVRIQKAAKRMYQSAKK